MVNGSLLRKRLGYQINQFTIQVRVVHWLQESVTEEGTIRVQEENLEYNNNLRDLTRSSLHPDFGHKEMSKYRVFYGNWTLIKNNSIFENNEDHCNSGARTFK